MNTLLKTNRTFGIELELGFPNEGDIYDVRDNLNGSWNLTRDGSLTCNNPIEIVSPILKGEKGIKEVKQVCEIIKEHGGDADHPSCGFHVHHGAKELLPTKEVTVLGTEEAEAMLRNKKEPINYAVFIPDSVITTLAGGGVMKITKSDYKRTADWFFRNTMMGDCSLGRVYQNSKIAIMYTSKDRSYKLFIVERPLLDKLREQKNKKIDELYKHELYKDAEYEEIEYEKKVISLMVPESGKVVVNYDREGNFEGLKRILYFYTMFSPVLQNMVQDSRKIGNMYCIGMRDSFDLDEIYNLKNTEELEILWYKARNKDDVREQKRQHYNDSRYHEVNLHSLWYRHGTIEIRSHSSTIDWKQIMLWTGFHQHIIEACISGEVTLEDISKASKITDVRELTLFMLGILKLPFNVDKYVRRLVNYFAILKEPI